MEKAMNARALKRRTPATGLTQAIARSSSVGVKSGMFSAVTAAPPRALEFRPATQIGTGVQLHRART
ncbi:MAG: hypothetical protein KGJ86_08995, partial [Chloroflexota bacterium]|nr:hypothetical protein [Chloroflexota bacterium]